MSDTFRAQADRHRVRPPFLAVLVAAVALVGLVGCYPQTSSPTGAPPAGAGVSRLASPRGQGDVPGELPRLPRGDEHSALDIAEGEVPDDVTVFDDQYPAVAKLDPELLSALRSAATAAEGEGVQMYVDSGWRSRRYQEQLFRDAVAKYGSAEQAARWVARPGTSAHEAGQAVDLGPSDATSWLSQRGAGYGLCQIYGNEPWHFELRPAAVAHGCPTMYADPTYDPRMQQ
jgi:D-alanyl-D-alanine carboxypeptidase